MKTGYYRFKQIEGSRYEEFIIQKLEYLFGFVLHLREGEKAQLRGETDEGFEIKYDGRMKDTGNVYIELEEKSNPDNFNYVESGIYRNDNTKFYLIGDYKECFVFGKKALQELDRENPSFIIRPKPTGTSIGFLIPVKYAKKLAERYIVF